MEENRSRKRDELIESLPADKRICSLNIPVPMMTSPEIETTATTSSSSPSISGRSSEPDHKMTMMDSASNGSCDSDGGEELDHQYEAVAAGQLAAGARVFRYNGRQLQVEKSKIKNIASNLKAEAGPGSQFAAVTELCDILSFCSEELPGSYAELLAPGLVALTKEESNPDIVILSIRCITYLCDIVYQSSVSLVHYDVLPALCARLMNIEYLDVAEQCLQALERISEEQPHACLEAGVILASLSYIDFFSTSIQRVALSTVANVCKDLPADRTSLYMDAVPILCNLLQYEDQKLVENVASSLIRIVERVKNSSDLLEEVCKHGLIHQATHLIALNSRSPLTQSVHTGLIGMLCTLASGSVAAVRTLLELNISDTLKQILSSYDLARDVVRGDQCNQVHKFMKLLNELLPPLTGNSEEAPIVSDKEKILADQPELLQQFGVNILPVLVQVVSSGVNLHVSYCCLSVINKLVHFSRPEMLLQFLESTNISSFLASAFTRKDRHVLIVVLDIVENIMKKLPDVFLCTFIKEGVVYGIDTLLLLPENCSDDSSMSSSIQLLPRSSQRPAAREVARCLCYAFEIEQSPPSSATTCKLEEGCVHTLAKRIKDSYFATKSDNSGIGLTETLEKLRNLCGMLVDKVHVSMENHFCVQQEESLSHLLGEIMSVLNAGDMSTFEFIESGIVKSLLTYLSNDHATKEKVGVHGHVDNSDVIVHRLEMFARLSLCSSGRNWEGTPFAVLIKKLQSALSSLENFPIILSHVSKPRTTHASIPLERNTLLPCLRVRFVREEGETGLGDYAASAVTIEPFSTLNDIEKFLLPKVRKQIAEHHDDQSTDKPEDLPIQGSSSSCPQVEDQSASEEDPERPDAEPMDIDDATTSDIASSSKDGKPGDSASSTPTKLRFFLKGKQIDQESTLYQAIIQQKLIEEQEVVVGPVFWNEVYQVTYGGVAENKINAEECLDGLQNVSVRQNCYSFWQNVPFFHAMMISELKCGVEKSDPTYQVLFLLKILEGVNKFSFHLMSQEQKRAFSEGKKQDLDDLVVITPRVPPSEFVNIKMTEKLEQQMRDSLAVSTGSMPSWCSQLMITCPYLFGFELKCKYFRQVALGSMQVQPHLLTQLVDSNPTSPTSRNSRIKRKKFQVSRNKILDSALKMMDHNASQKGVLEVEYHEEVGSGLGPTMEFFTLVSHEFQKVGLNMWRGDYSSVTLKKELMIEAPLGYFPRPLSQTSNSSLNESQEEEVMKKFVLLGQIVAKALQDGRVFDFLFSKAFYKLILEQELNIYDIQSIDPELGRTMLEFQALAERKNNSQSTSESYFRNTRIEDLWLEFSLPGYPDYMLSTGDQHKMVNFMNLEEYVSSILDATVNSGISRQVEAFKSGFNQLFPVKNLQIFTEDELERLLCGEQDAWTSIELLEHIKFDHGYSASSPPIVNLLEIIQEFDYDQKRAFLQFVTGAPRLPPGGLAALNPQLTVVRKVCTEWVDGDLPSVMTCANYLKLPPYSTKERMRERLLYAITEGQGSFHLS
ncbi:HECT-type E3 ubiquitin transferase [Ranunculus cassubicifolius]